MLVPGGALALAPPDCLPHSPQIPAPLPGCFFTIPTLPAGQRPGSQPKVSRQPGAPGTSEDDGLGQPARGPWGRVSSKVHGRHAEAGCRHSATGCRCLASPPASGGWSRLVCRRRRRAPSRAPRAAWQPATAPGVRSFLTTSQVPELIWELFISCQKTALPAKKTTLAAERPRAWYEGSPGLNHKAPAVWLESKAGRARGPVPYGST